MTKKKHFVIAVLAAACFSIALIQCDAADDLVGDGGGLPDLDTFCGTCGKVSNGDATISGNAKLDGIFKAIGTLNLATGSIKANFDTHVKALAKVFGIATVNTDGTAKTTAALVTEIKAQFNAQILAQLEGGIEVQYQEPKCSADISVSVSAQAQCEAKAGCTVDAECDPGELSFTCEGTCSGSCDGTCSGNCTVQGELAASCTGTCKGSCDLSVSGGGCDGTCKGTCSGNCSLTNAQGQCEGKCEGTCTGTCELPSIGGSCSGSCKGECTMDASAQAKCEGKCEASCSGKCTGGCEGKFDPPSCTAEGSCDASADCKAQAEAQASASLTCTPPSLDIAYNFKAGATADVQADVMGKLDLFKAEMIGVIQGMAELKILIEGKTDANGVVVVESPLAQLKTSVSGFVSGGVDGLASFSVAPGLIPCVIPAFTEAGNILASLGTNMSATISAQADLFAVLSI